MKPVAQRTFWRNQNIAYINLEPEAVMIAINALIEESSWGEDSMGGNDNKISTI